MPAFSLGCINSPDVAGAGSNYVPASIPLTSGASAKGMLPAMVVYPKKDTATRSYNRFICDGQELELQAPAGYLRYFSQGNRIQQATVTVNSTGTYWIASEDDCTYKRSIRIMWKLMT